MFLHWQLNIKMIFGGELQSILKSVIFIFINSEHLKFEVLRKQYHLYQHQKA
jgi:hypothetical protein